MLLHIFRTLHAYSFKNKQSGNHIGKSKFKNKRDHSEDGAVFYINFCGDCYNILLSRLRISVLLAMATKLQKLHDVRIQML